MVFGVVLAFRVEGVRGGSLGFLRRSSICVGGI